MYVCMHAMNTYILSHPISVTYFCSNYFHLTQGNDLPMLRWFHHPYSDQPTFQRWSTCKEHCVNHCRRLVVTYGWGVIVWRHQNLYTEVIQSLACRRKEKTGFFNDTLDTFYLRSYSERGNPLPYYMSYSFRYAPSPRHNSNFVVPIVSPLDVRILCGV